MDPDLGGQLITDPPDLDLADIGNVVTVLAGGGGGFSEMLQNV
jgi:hypothetical protein